jgi:light-independent protochlorophyllide reductase subunit B
MKLAYWMYVGPAHIGTLRVASSFKNVHAIMHAPLGDDYFNVMRSMFERERDFTPVTTSIVDRHVLARGSQDKVIQSIKQKNKQDNPDLILLTPTCTSSILQEDLHQFVDQATQLCDCDVLLADVNHYRVNELQAADRTLEQVIRFYTSKPKLTEIPSKSEKPSVNILGVFTLGFHHQHDCRELVRLFEDLGISVNLVIPESASVTDLKDISKAWFNFVPYREVGLMAAKYLEKEFNMPYLAITPMGIIDTSNCIREIAKLLNKLNQTSNYNFESYINKQLNYNSQAGWFSQSIDCQNLTSKKAFVFGDATHAAQITKILTRELGVQVVCAGTYCLNESNWFVDQVEGLVNQVLITDDHTQVGDLIAKLEPAVIFGTQMERHVGKRLDIPCGVISAPVHIQNFPLSYRPFLGYEGTNQIADLIYNSFTLGMEDHLLEIFGGHDTKEVITKTISSESGLTWTSEAEMELKRIPGFVRGKVKRNTERYARTEGITSITAETLFSAKEALER